VSTSNDQTLCVDDINKLVLPEWVSSRRQLSPHRWNNQRKGQAPKLAARVVPSWTSLTVTVSRSPAAECLIHALFKLLWLKHVLCSQQCCFSQWFLTIGSSENFTALLWGITQDCIQVKLETKHSASLKHGHDESLFTHKTHHFKILWISDISISV